jgi:hypothetical protein
MISTRSMRSIAALAATATAVLFLTTVSGNAASSGSQKACQNALDMGTKSALRAFLRKYPKSDTACNALASTDVSVSVSVSAISDSSEPLVNSSGVSSSFNTGSVPVVTNGGGSTGNGGQGGGSQSGGSQSGDLLSDLKGEIAKIANGQ